MQGLPIVPFKPITRRKAKQTPREKLESVVNINVHYTIKELTDFAYSFKQKSEAFIKRWSNENELDMPDIP